MFANWEIVQIWSGAGRPLVVKDLITRRLYSSLNCWPAFLSGFKHISCLLYDCISMKTYAGCDDVLQHTVFSRTVVDVLVALKGCFSVIKYAIPQHLGLYYDCISVQEVRKARADNPKTTTTKLHDNTCLISPLSLTNTVWSEKDYDWLYIHSAQLVPRTGLGTP